MVSPREIPAAGEVHGRARDKIEFHSHSGSRSVAQIHILGDDLDTGSLSSLGAIEGNNSRYTGQKLFLIMYAKRPPWLFKGLPLVAILKLP